MSWWFLGYLSHGGNKLALLRFSVTSVLSLILMVPSFQLIVGLTSFSHGIPKMRFSLP